MRAARAPARPRTSRACMTLFPRLAERGAQLARTMSGGEQQMVAIGRALMSAPKLLLLDEPSLGLSPLMCGELFQALARIRETGVGILLVEQNAEQGLNIADRGYLIETGRIVGQGSAQCAARTIRRCSAPISARARFTPPRRGRQRWRNQQESTGQETTMKHVNLMIGDRDAPPPTAAPSTAIDPFTGEVATPRGGGLDRAMPSRPPTRRPRRSRHGRRSGPSERRCNAAQGRRPARRQGRGVLRADDRRVRRDRPVGAFQQPLRREPDARGRLDDHAGRRRGDPVRQAEQFCDGDPPAGRRRARHRAVERAGDPRRAGDRDAARLRQHRRAQGVRNVPGDASR